MKFTTLATFAAASLITVGSTALIATSSNALPSLTEDTSVLVAAKSELDTKGELVAVGSGKQAAGAFQVIEEDGKKYLQFNEDFRVSSGPALEVILHQDSNVASSINEGDYISLAPLQSTSGSQRYEIPNNLDIEDYASVAVWCEEFNVTFGYGVL